MILYEFEGKEILKKYGINVPSGQIISSTEEKVTIRTPYIVKAQVLSGKRKDAGGIGSNIDNILGKVVNKEKVEKVLVEEKIEFTKEFYLSLSYDTEQRGVVLNYSESGGTGIEGREVFRFSVDLLTLQVDYKKIEVPEAIKEFVPNLLRLFLEEDATLVEINPLVLSGNSLVALDAKVKLDDPALGRHKDWNFPPRSVPGHTPTKQEIEAKKIDENDYRGTAGSTYFDLPGDIAVLASGGGGSLTAMDALLAAGGFPANYTEYSGNPPKEKVEKLTQIVLSKKNINALWVVGAIANFTDIYETMSGFIEALRKINPKPKFPIVIRRGGPKDKEAFEMLKEIKDFDLHLYGGEISITESAKIVADLAKKYAAIT